MMHVIFDVDGTLANCDHRLRHLAGPKKNWDAFYAAMDQDTCNNRLAELADALFQAGWTIIVCTGRPETYRYATETWLRAYYIPHAKLYMRPDGDHRPDTVVKKELLAQMRADGFDPVLAIEDRASVVRMWREEGLTCLQCAEGDF